MIRAVIFDFDGTICDTETLDLECWQNIYAEYDCELTLRAWSDCVGTTYDLFHPVSHLQKLTGTRLDGEQLERRHDENFRRKASVQPCISGVEDCLLRARGLGLRIGLASSGIRGRIEDHLARLNLVGFFDCIRTAGDVKRVKPDPELYLSVLQGLGVGTAAEAIAFEDSPNGVKAAKAAGVFCVAVPNRVTAELALDHADMVVDKLSGPLLEQLIHQAL